ncbi:SH3 domain-containing protein [Actinomadura sp. WMMA1423]|uniref:SH3 domain-containing protein n=1 Tax=Actinomadura sp. WMMA1423 TaxID=2591108 RepID=UPI0011477BA7|nr:SH3 domain-containing protein [Actinomadura sp. WMMA1423]
MALAVAGAASGLTLLSGGAVAGAATAANHVEPATSAQQVDGVDGGHHKVCRYEVIAKHGLGVRTGPGLKYKRVGTLHYGAHIGADCKRHGWTQLRQGVPHAWIGKWVAVRYLKPIRPIRVCRYEVIAKHGLAVRQGPGLKYKKVGTLPYGKHIGADCKNSGWTQLRQSVPPAWIGKWVAVRYLKPIRPHGGAAAGGGGTSMSSNFPMLAGAGLGVLALGGGIAVVARRRQVKGVS